jgi:hypothetical protein
MIHESSFSSAALAKGATESDANVADAAARPMLAFRKLRRLGRQSRGNIIGSVREVRNEQME